MPYHGDCIVMTIQNSLNERYYLGRYSNVKILFFYENKKTHGLA